MKEFLPRPRVLRPPLGYVDLQTYLEKGGDPSLPSNYPVEEQDNILYPDPVIVPLLSEALDQLDAGISLRAAAEWYNNRIEELGNEPSVVSHAGLKKIWDRERPDHPKRPVTGRPKNSIRMPREKRVKTQKVTKIGNEKRKIAFAKKRIEKLEQELEDYQTRKKREKEQIHVEYTGDIVEELPEIKEEPIFVPNPGPQEDFLGSTELEVLYGGSAGGELKSEFYRLLLQ